MQKRVPERGQDAGYRGSRHADSLISKTLVLGLLLLAGGVGCDLKSMGPSTGPGLEPPGAGTASGGGDSFGNATRPDPMANPRSPQVGAGGTAAVAPPPMAGSPEQVTGSGGAASPGAAGTGSFMPPTVSECTDTTRLAVEQEPGVMWPWEPQPTLTCRYMMPSEAIAFMPERVALGYNAAGVVTVVPHVADADACDPMTGGWYYDLTLNVPRIVVCPQSCKDTGAELVLGCPVATAP